MQFAQPAFAADQMLPGWCGTSSVLYLGDLPSELPFSRCALAGRTVRAHRDGIGAGIPPAGYGVAASAGDHTVEVWSDEYAVHVGEPVSDVMSRYPARMMAAEPHIDRARMGASIERFVQGTVGIVGSTADDTARLLEQAADVSDWAASGAGSGAVPAHSLAEVQSYVEAVRAHGRDDRPDVVSLHSTITGIAMHAAADRELAKNTANRELTALLVLRSYAVGHVSAADEGAVDALARAYRAAIGRGGVSVRLPASSASLRADVDRVADVVRGSPTAGEVSEESLPDATSPAPCSDTARNYLFPGSPPTHWATGSTIQWYYNYTNQFPRYSATGYSQALTRAFDGMTGLSDDCGFNWHPNLDNQFAGFTTSSTPDASYGTCAAEGTTDGRSVIGWSPSMPAPSPGARATYGYACAYRNVYRTLIVETDVVMSTRTSWDIPELDGSIGYVCNRSAGDLDVQGGMTHEFGHSVGLAHVDESTHGRLTMSPVNDGPCQRQERTLGRGDAIGLSSMYGQVS